MFAMSAICIFELDVQKKYVQKLSLFSHCSTLVPIVV